MFTSSSLKLQHGGFFSFNKVFGRLFFSIDLYFRKGIFIST